MTDPAPVAEPTLLERIETQRAETLRSLTDADLVAAILKVEHDPPNQAGTTVRAWLIGELEGRHPEIDDGLNAWADDAASDRTYGEVLADLLGIAR